MACGSLSPIPTLKGSLSSEDNIKGALSSGDRLIGGISKLVSYYDYYTGEYNVIPNSRTQTLETANRYLTQNVIINPIPSNYGLVTWNGQCLTIS